MLQVHDAELGARRQRAREGSQVAAAAVRRYRVWCEGRQEEDAHGRCGECNALKP